jgi:uncharacterized membrane protein
MRTAIALVMTLALAAVCGCGWLSRTSPQGGSLFTDDGFKIAVPVFDTSVKQGEVQTVTVSLLRGKNFKQDVTLQVKATKGISVAPTDISVKASDKPELQLRIEAAKDAAIGEYRVHVKGTPKTGEATSVQFAVKVVAP